MNNINDNLQQINARIRSACTSASRDPESVKLLAVSKTKPVEMVIRAMEAGQYDFGENYLQDALSKIISISEASGDTATRSPSWHYIGAIQSNKTRDIARHFDWVHTVASEKVARRLNSQRPEDLPAINILLQVNLNQEAGKAGIDHNNLAGLVDSLLTFDRIALRGLMAIPEVTKDYDQQRANFARLADFREEIQAKFDLDQFTELSMGMSADLEAAIAEGASWVRIGTAIFGERESSAAKSQ